MPPKKCKIGRKAAIRKRRPSKASSDEELSPKKEPTSPSKDDGNEDPDGSGSGIKDSERPPPSTSISTSEKDEAKKESTVLKCRVKSPEEVLCRGGRLSKISARSKMKEIVYKEEPLTPEDCEDDFVRRPSSPQGVRRFGQSKLKRGRAGSSLIAAKKGKIEKKTIVRKRRPKITSADCRLKSSPKASKSEGPESGSVPAKKEPTSPSKDDEHQDQDPTNATASSSTKENEAEQKPGTSSGLEGKSITAKKNKIEKKTVIRKRRPKIAGSTNLKSTSSKLDKSGGKIVTKKEPCSPSKDTETKEPSTSADLVPSTSTSLPPGGNIEPKTENDLTAAQATSNAPPKKPFFRGRRSKISARSGRKEVVYKEEPINPEDIAGFEHVEKFVTPPGIKLPKFWDSEDELSEDETNDNFRRIMCGFGVNCRIHDVIRPTSEIVRRMKELQNTFGSSKTLPLFLKDGSTGEEPSLDLEEESQDGSGSAERQVQLSWHTDPKYFQYANNYP